jgi:hypothetical protein
MEKIFNIIAFCLKEIETKNNWEPFDELVCNLSSHKAQASFLSDSIHKENLLHAGNGFGKTDLIAKKHIRFILKHILDENYKTLNISITLEQAQLVQERILKISKNSPLLSSWFIKDSVGMPSPKIRYFNGSITEFKSTKKKAESVEGKEFGYISADEIALELYLEFIRDKILLPRLRRWKDSQLEFFATPKGMNAYYRIAQDIKRKGGCVRSGSSFDNPFIDHELMKYQMSTWSQSRIDQVIYGKFIDTADMMFASRIEKLFDSSLTFQEVDKGHQYLEGWDLARGRKGSASDQTVGFRVDLSLPTPQIVNRWAFQLPWTEKERENLLIKKEFNSSSIEREIRLRNYESNSKVFIDSTGLGDTLFGIIQDIAQGVDFRGGRKDFLLDHLQIVIDSGKIKAPFIPELVDEMTTYQRDDKNLATDNLMALAIVCSGIDINNRKFGTTKG